LTPAVTLLEQHILALVPGMVSSGPGNQQKNDKLRFIFLLFKTDGGAFNGIAIGFFSNYKTIFM
jgi:hypothetical protein